MQHERGDVRRGHRAGQHRIREHPEEAHGDDYVLPVPSAECEVLSAEC